MSLTNPGDIRAIHDDLDQIGKNHNPAEMKAIEEALAEYEVGKIAKQLGNLTGIDALKQWGNDEEKDAVNRAFKDGHLDWKDMAPIYDIDKRANL